MLNYSVKCLLKSQMMRNFGTRWVASVVRDACMYILTTFAENVQLNLLFSNIMINHI